MKLKLLELSLLPAMVYKIPAWGRIMTTKVDEIENTKLSSQTVAESPNISINCKSTDGDRNMTC